MRFGDATSSSDGFHTDPDVRLTLEILGFFEDRNWMEEPKDNDTRDTAGSDDVIWRANSVVIPKQWLS